MRIRTKIFAGCLCLTMLTILLGGFAQLAERELGRVALRIFDGGLMSVSYLRSAQVGFIGLASGLFTTEQADDIISDLEVARDRAMSEKGRTQAEDLRQRVSTAIKALQSNGSADAGQPEDHTQSLAEVQPLFEATAETFSADGFLYRKNVVQAVATQARHTWIALSLSLAMALIITVVINHKIAPPVRRAVRIAQAIAGGKLDNSIAIRGSGETAELLRALHTMQASIAKAMQRISQLMAEQEVSYTGQLAAQHEKLEAALDNMNQGLCLFGSDGRLAVSNRRFAEMFGAPTVGASPRDAFADPDLKLLADCTAGGRPGVFTCDLPDGRVIAVAQQLIATGGWVTTYEDISERRASEARLEHMARHDALTGLPNRLFYAEHMPQAIARSRRAGGLAILCLDLDRFKTVNDTLGHAVGDALLIAVADRIRNTTRQSDFVVRMGGDEFTIVQESAVQPAEATMLARRLIESLEATFDIDGQSVAIGVSVGIAMSQDGLSSPEALLKCADLALYRAKAEGRGAFRFFEAEMDLRMQVRRAMELDLRQALVRNEFEMLYQPLIEAQSGEITGFEALLRWRHMERGLVSPALFIPVLEEMGLIGVVGAWVLQRACSDAASWETPLKVAVNLSPDQFRGRALVKDVAEALKMSGLPASRLELEITESTLIEDDEAVLEVLHALRALGVRISMDDFGTGYSSLGYLRRFPFDKIKIDQSFVRGMMEEGDCLAIIRAVIGLGRSLGINVNAEGVETAEQYAALQREGCGELQGYLFSKPKPQSELSGMILASANVSDTV